MKIDVDKLDVVNNTAKSRFEVQVGADLAMIEYQIAGTTIIFTHTEVPTAFEGMGIANKMAKVALNFARDHGYRIQPACPFIAAYIRRYKEYQPITEGY
ncbi:MAG: N-acetyltransferase [Phototrophicales bacterium]|nr:MAG: N-acetyltransferase [Phototrophicales bacterium]